MRLRIARVLAAAAMGVVPGCGGDAAGPAPTGQVEVVFTATGADIPPSMRLDVDATIHNLDLNTAFTDTLAAGPHTVTLYAVPNCSVSGAAFETRQVIVQANATTQVAFVAACVSLLAQVSITVSTGGPDPTPYFFTTDLTNGSGGIQAHATVLAESTAVLGSVVPGTWTVDIGYVPDNCTVAGGHPRQLQVHMGDSLTVQFDLTCGRPSGLGLAAGPYVIQASGGGVGLVHDGGASDWSPDGTRLAYVARDTIWTIAPDGTGRTRVAFLPAVTTSSDLLHVSHPIWSPDGTRIAMVSASPSGQDVYVLNADGTGLVALTTEGSAKKDLHWSPDGSRLVYASNGDLYLLAADGSSLRSVTTGRFAGAAYPSWSPDGSRLAFESGLPGAADVYVIDTTGTTVLLLTPGPETGATPAWSPVDERIAYFNTNVGTASLVLIGSDGSGRVALPKWGTEPAWSPDGSRIAYLVDIGPCGQYVCISLWVPAVVRTDGAGAVVFQDVLARLYMSWGQFQ